MVDVATTPVPSPVTPVNQPVNPRTFDFPVGTRFIMSGVVYTVRKSIKDVNIEWRSVVSVNQEQDFMLMSLRRDASDDSSFAVLEIPTNK